MQSWVKRPSLDLQRLTALGTQRLDYSVSMRSTPPQCTQDQHVERSLHDLYSVAIFVPSRHDVGNLYPKDVDRLSPPDSAPGVWTPKVFAIDNLVTTT
jgi:hypothetical protein